MKYQFLALALLLAGVSFAKNTTSTKTLQLVGEKVSVDASFQVAATRGTGRGTGQGRGIGNGSGRGIGNGRGHVVGFVQSRNQ